MGVIYNKYKFLANILHINNLPRIKPGRFHPRFKQTYKTINNNTEKN